MRNIAALFSLLMPGFGQIYNQQFIKGISFVIIEHFDNMFGKINKSIQLDFNGFHHQALEMINYNAMLFYPGFYMYVVWDAWYYAKDGANKTITAIPFIFGGFLGELGAIFSTKLPFASLTVGLFMIIPSIFAMIFFRHQ
ncbi:hypothetical protein [Heyndrickxia ginsengihumi]|uniref:DUF5683 domain-containing protein n=1 Tax=Heyndrickxia ginsengihumi TaxID=363870 RepID=A0A0A6VCA7_9BACI|nr:hypothetical protein [Heyndrickxia ginsengihumi]KHD84179.1 hypothetical protein NG54_17215 [Heyndrickxia ginsengihumi]MBE6184134.1 hypothetical protein [Bacillus sp. (in: firmicutes)]NEY20479.1 hypothetical protein [Heyndrickxia ginsengihumi]